MVKVCEICGLEFDTKNSSKRICNREHIKICEVCGKEYILKDATPQRMIDRRTCYNKECINKLMNKRIETTNKEKYGCSRPLQNNDIKKKMEETCIEKYRSSSPFGSKVVKEKIRSSVKEKYGTSYYMETNEFRQKSKETCLEKYGTELAINSEEIREKQKKTMKEKYGVEYGLQSEEILEKTKQTCIKKYGRPAGSYFLSKKETQDKVKATMEERYGVPYFVLTEAGRLKTNITKPNKRFSDLLTESGINNSFEFRIGNSSFDLYVPEDILIEINPTPYHNSTWHPYKDPKDKFYHYNKSKIARENGYRCIHVFDWDDQNKIVNLLKSKEILYARKLKLKEISKKDLDNFLNEYHLQGTCNNQIIRLGFYKDNELIQVMTFGKPRYNKNYKYELLRLCTHKDYKVVGGAERLFKYFLKKYKPESIISYCDLSKFKGDIYEKLGFKRLKQISPSKHWYHIKDKIHITDNLLRQRGFDQLFNTNYGKGTSNEQLMLEHGFVEIYDCGQQSYVYNK